MPSEEAAPPPSERAAPRVGRGLVDEEGNEVDLRRTTPRAATEGGPRTAPPRASRGRAHRAAALLAARGQARRLIFAPLMFLTVMLCSAATLHHHRRTSSRTRLSCSRSSCRSATRWMRSRTGCTRSAAAGGGPLGQKPQGMPPVVPQARPRGRVVAGATGRPRPTTRPTLFLRSEPRSRARLQRVRARSDLSPAVEDEEYARS